MTTPNFQLNTMRYRIRAISDTNLVMQLMVEADDEMAARRLAEEQGLRVATVVMARRPLATLLRPAMTKAARLPLLLFSRGAAGAARSRPGNRGKPGSAA